MILISQGGPTYSRSLSLSSDSPFLAIRLLLSSEKARFFCNKFVSHSLVQRPSALVKGQYLVPPGHSLSFSARKASNHDMLRNAFQLNLEGKRRKKGKELYVFFSI